MVNMVEMVQGLEELAGYIKKNGVTEEAREIFDKIGCGTTKEFKCKGCPIEQIDKTLCLKLMGFENDENSKAIDLRAW